MISSCLNVVKIHRIFQITSFKPLVHVQSSQISAFISTLKLNSLQKFKKHQFSTKSSKPPSLFSSLMDLSKARLSALVVLTSVGGFLAYGPPLNTEMLIACSIGTALCSFSACTFNQVIERKRDAMMYRTKGRPLPSHRVTLNQAGTWGVGTGIAGSALLGISLNPIVAGLGLGNIFLYSGIYTPMKRYSEWNTWIGSVVGAIPPLMGWAAASGGNLMAIEPWILATLLYLWQFPHFFSLAWMGRKDYGRADFKMVAVSDKSGERTGGIIWYHSLALTALPLLCYLTNTTSGMFLVEGMAINGYLLYLAHQYTSNKKGYSRDKGAKKIFYTSLWYLPLMMGLYLYHSKRWKEATFALEARERMRELCMHETMVDKDSLCPQLVGEKMEEEVGEKVREGGELIIETAERAKQQQEDSLSKKMG